MFKFLCPASGNAADNCVLTKGLSRKQQAIADREHELLHIAKAIVEAEGYANLTMDKITAASPYSKGTIYNHFSSKEDVITALCSQALRHQISFLKRATAFPGSSRERALALHVAYVMSAKVEPVLFSCLLTAKTPWVIQKASVERLQTQAELEQQCTELIDSMLLTAVAEGELTLSHGGVDSVVFANWAMTFGGVALMTSASSCQSISRVQNQQVFLQNINWLLDGMNWQPLSSRFDYFRTWQRVEQEIFSDELALLATL